MSEDHFLCKGLHLVSHNFRNADPCMFSKCSCRISNANLNYAINFVFISSDTYVLLNASVNIETDEKDKLCVSCLFMINVTNRYCSLQVENDGTYVVNLKAFQEQGTILGTACVSQLPSGTYSVLVCSTDCTTDHSTQLIFTYHNLTIVGIGKFIHATST